MADRANNATVQEQDGRWTVQGDPTEGALLVAARKAGLEPDALDARLPRVGEVPFSSERKLMSTVHRDARAAGAHGIVFTKGAPDVLLRGARSKLVGDGRRPLTDERRAEILRSQRGAGRRGAADARRRATAGCRRTRCRRRCGERSTLEQDLVFAGLIGMIDPPRAEAKEAVARAKGAGIRPMMITGDHPRTAAVIAAGARHRRPTAGHHRRRAREAVGRGARATVARGRRSTRASTPSTSCGSSRRCSATARSSR